MNISLYSILSVILISSVVFGCKGLKSNLLVLDGINVAETPGLLADIEALNVPVVLAVSMLDLKAFSNVRLIAREAALRGNYVVLSTNDPGMMNGEIKREWSELMSGVPLKYSTKSFEYTLDLSPDHITAVLQLVAEKIIETPSLGRVIYLNSFGAGVRGKALSVIQAYQANGFQFVSLPDCLKK